MIIKISNQLFESIKERSALYTAADLLAHDFSIESPSRTDIFRNLHIQTTRQLYNFMKKQGYVFDSQSMKWRIK